MPVNSSRNPAAATLLAWRQAHCDWPVEKVVVLVDVSVPRELTLFEWVVGRMLEAFGPQVSTLSAAAERLGIHDPVFLRQALETLIQLGAVEHQGPPAAADLPGCRLTPMGLELLRAGHIATLRERHGLTLHFDALTGEHLPRPPRAIRPNPDRPVVAAASLNPRTTSIGLDRVRDLARLQREPFQGGESQIVAAELRSELGALVWQRGTVELAIDGAGKLRGRVVDGSETRQGWFDTHGGSVVSHIASESRPAWANGRWQPQPMSVGAFRDGCDRLVGPEELATVAARMIQGAKAEVLLQRGWLDAKEVREALPPAARHGVRCYVLDEAGPLEHWTVQPEEPPGFVSFIDGNGSPRPMVLIADSRQGLRVDRLSLQPATGEPIEVPVGTSIKPTALASLRSELIATPITEASGGDIRHQFGIVALTRDLTLWEQGAQRIWLESSGSERVRQLRDWAQWGRAVLPEAELLGGRLGWAIQAWEALVQQDFDREEVLNLAIGLLPPQEVLARLSAAIEAATLPDDPVLLPELIQLAVDVHGRWGGFDLVAGCPGFIRRLRDRLIKNNGAALAQTMDQVFAILRERHPSSPELGLIAGVLSSALPAPNTPAELADWLETHSGLRPHLGDRFVRTARQHLSRVVARTGSPSPNPELDRLQRAWREMKLPEEALSLAQRRQPAAAPAWGRAG